MRGLGLSGLDLGPPERDAAGDVGSQVPWYVPLAGLGCALVPLRVIATATMQLGERFMGEVKGEQFYLLAAARDLFERGTGVSYPNPYDERPTDRRGAQEPSAEE